MVSPVCPACGQSVQRSYHMNCCVLEAASRLWHARREGLLAEGTVFGHSLV